MNKLIVVLALTAASAGWAVTPFELPWMNNTTEATTYRSSDHASGIFVVEAYFLGCPYCNENAPNVNDLADKFANEPRVQVLDVGVDRRDADYKTWIRRHNPNHPVLKDSNRSLIKQLGTKGYPSTYVLDCKGNVTYKSTGEWSQGTKRQLMDAVNELLKSDCKTDFE